MAVARIVVDTKGTARVHSPYEARAVIKATPGARWNKPERCWVIDAAFINMTADALRQVGYRVFVTNEGGEPYTSTGSHGTRDTPAPDWVEQAFRAAPVAEAEKLRRGLMAVFHPDKGGNLELAKQINVAADRRVRRA